MASEQRAARKLSSLAPSPRLALALAFALASLTGLGCPLPTSLGELPSTSATSTSTTAESTSESDGGFDPSATTMIEPPSETTGGMVGPLPMHAWTMRYEDWVALGGADSDSGGVTGDGGTEISPDALVVQISTAPDDCTNPQAPMSCGSQWVIFMVIPPELQEPGSYDIFTQLSGFFSVTGPFEGPGSCSGGAGSLDGTAELTAVSDQEVRGRLSMTDAFDFDANVEFVALGCGF